MTASREWMMIIGRDARHIQISLIFCFRNKSIIWQIFLRLKQKKNRDDRTFGCEDIDRRVRQSSLFLTDNFPLLNDQELGD